VPTLCPRRFFLVTIAVGLKEQFYGSCFAVAGTGLYVCRFKILTVLLKSGCSLNTFASPINFWVDTLL